MPRAPEVRSAYEDEIGQVRQQKIPAEVWLDEKGRVRR